MDNFGMNMNYRLFDAYFDAFFDAFAMIFLIIFKSNSTQQVLDQCTLDLDLALEN